MESSFNKDSINNVNLNDKLYIVYDKETVSLHTKEQIDQALTDGLISDSSPVLEVTVKRKYEVNKVLVLNLKKE